MSTANDLTTRYLHEAVKKRQHDLVASFLAQPDGIDVNVRDGYGMTALMWAAGRGFYDMAVLLLQRGAEVDARNELLSVQTIEKLETDKDDYCVMIDRMGMLHANKHHGWTALVWASRNGRNSLASLLIDSGANINAITRDGFTALAHAIDNKHEEVAHLLLELGADPNLAEVDCSPALPLAAKYGFVTLVQALLDHGADINAVDNFNHNALCNAVTNNQPEVLRLLLDRGLDVNVTCAGLPEWPPLHSAANSDALECAHLLLDKGADINAKDGLNGMTALEFSVEEMAGPRVAQLLIERGADTKGALGRIEYFRTSASGDELAEADAIIALIKGKAGSKREFDR